MATQTATKTQAKTAAPPPAQSKGDLAIFQPPRLPWHPAIGERFGVDKTQWKPLVEAIYPAAKTVDSVVMALSYCRARNLDPFKRPVHIVPIWDKNKRTYVETVWPGIAELRTTAFRTGQYAGCDEAEFGEEIGREFTGRIKKGDGWEDIAAEVEFPEWCRITVYRELAGRVCKFVGPKVYWLESYATIGNSDVPNDMWQSRPRGQLEKCAEAAALRKAFPEELGNEYAAEEMGGRNIEVTPPSDAPALPERPTRDDFREQAQSQPTEQQTETAGASEAEPAGQPADDADADRGEARDPEAIFLDLVEQLAGCSMPEHIDELISYNAETIAGFTPPEEASWSDAVKKRRAALQAKGGKR